MRYPRKCFGSIDTPPKHRHNKPLDLRFLTREPAEVYHAKAKDFLSSHWLAEFRRCPLLYRRKRMGLIPRRESTAFLVGRAAHTLILEGRERYEAEFAVGGPINPKTDKPFGSGTKAFAEWAERIGKSVLSDDQAAVIEQMAAAVKAHIFARELLAIGQAEGVIRRAYAGHACQVRLDWINPIEGRGIVDLKTCDSLDSFEFDICAFGYVHQLAFYLAVITESEMKPTKAGTGQYLQRTFQMLDGPYKGRLVWARLNLDNPSEMAVKIARAELSSICRSVGVMAPKDSIELHNLPLVLKVGCTKRNDTGDITNEIKGYEAKGSSQPVAAAPTSGTPPWKR